MTNKNILREGLMGLQKMQSLDGEVWPGVTERNLCPHILRSVFPYRAGGETEAFLATTSWPSPGTGSSHLLFSTPCCWVRPGQSG